MTTKDKKNQSGNVITIDEAKQRKIEKIQSITAKYSNLAMTEEEVNALTFEQRSALLDSLDYRKKYQLLRSADDAETLVRKMTAEDFFYTIEEAGRTDAMDLVVYTSPEQFTRILDITCWEHDRFDAQEMLDWFGYLIMNDPETAIEKLESLEFEMIVLLLAKFIHVHRFEWYELTSYIDDDALFSLDDNYIFELIDPENTNGERLAVFLQMLYRLNFELYTKTLEALIWEMSSEVEEDNFQAKNGRLLDDGYPEYLEALQILRPINPEKAKEKLLKSRQELPPIRSIHLPAYVRQTIEAEGFLGKVLDDLQPETAERVKSELYFLCNKLIVARKAMKRYEHVQETMMEAGLTLSLGLEYLSDSDTTKAKEVLESAYLTDVFQTGYSLPMQLHQKALLFHKGWIESVGRGAKALISSPTREALTALMRNPPLFYEGVTDTSKFESRPFRTLSEFEAVKKLVERIRFLFDLHFRLLALDLKDVAQKQGGIQLDPLDPDMRFVKVFLTAFVHHRLGEEAAYRPIPFERFEIFLKETIVANEDNESQGRFHVVNSLYQETERWLEKYVQNETDNYRYLASEWARRCIYVYHSIAAQLQGLEKRQSIILSQAFLLA